MQHLRSLIRCEQAKVVPFLLLVGFALLTRGSCAHAAYTVTFQEFDLGVVSAAGTGTFDTSTLGTPMAGIAPGGQVSGGRASVVLGATVASTASVYTAIAQGPSNFGVIVAESDANEGGNDKVLFHYAEGQVTLGLPTSYVSTNELSSYSVYRNTALTSLGLLSGTYTWTLGTTLTESFTVVVVPFDGTSVHEPVSLSMLGSGLAGLVLARTACRGCRGTRSELIA